MISVVVLQNEMVLRKGELRSSSDTHAVSTLDGNQVTGIEAERVSSVTEKEDLESTTIPEIKLERTVSGVPFKGFIICVYSALVLHAVHGTETYFVLRAVHGTETYFVLHAVHGTETYFVLHAVHGTETYCRLYQHLLLDQSPYSGLIQLMVCMI